MKYINKFSTNADYQTFTGGDGYVTPNICYVEETNDIIVKPDNDGGNSLTLPIKLYEGNNPNAEQIIDYIKSLDTDGNGYVGGEENGWEFLKNIINFNDLYYPVGCFIEDDNISGGLWYNLSDDSNYDDVLAWSFNLDGTLVIEWD